MSKGVWDSSTAVTEIKYYTIQNIIPLPTALYKTITKKMSKTIMLRLKVMNYKFKIIINYILNSFMWLY